MNTLNAPYEISIATYSEAELVNEKIDAFNCQQVSFHGDAEIFKDYVVKDSSLIIAGIRSCFYLGKCLVINVLFVDKDQPRYASNVHCIIW